VLSQIETADGLVRPSAAFVSASDESTPETFNPWTVVNVVFKHLADQGLHPILGDAGDPGEPAAALLRALGITPSVEGDARMSQRTRDKLAELRAAVMDDPVSG
jgi:hypothetical protein